MSSDRPSAGRSPTPDAGDLAALIRSRGAPLIEALEAHLPGAGEHADRTATYALAAAAEMGLERSRREAAHEAAKLHDVGKVYVPSELLARPADELSDADRATLDSHHEAGARLARGAGIPERVCNWILHARERFDGRGADGLLAIQIPAESRIIRAACTCDLLLAAAATAFSREMARREAIDGLRKQAGRELDPHAVEALARVLPRLG